MLIFRLPVGWACALLLASCAADTSGAPPLELLEPIDGAFVSRSEVVVRGTASSAAEVWINGEPTPVVDGAFRAVLALPEGPATITVAIPGARQERRVVVDSEVPIVAIDEPAPGSFLWSEDVRVTGRVVDGTGVRLTYEGEEVSLRSDGSFVLDTRLGPGAHRLRLVAQDEAGHVGSGFTSFLVGDYRDVSEPMNRAGTLSVGAEGLGMVGQTLAPHLSPEVVAPLLVAANPVAEGFWGEVNATGETHGAVNIALSPASGRLRLRMLVSDITVPFDARVGVSLRGVATARQAEVTGELAVDVSHDGSPVVVLESSNVRVDGLVIDVNGLWDWVDRNVITRALRGTITRSLQEAVATHVPPGLAAALAAIPEAMSFELFGYALEAEGRLRSVDLTNDAMSVVLDFGLAPGEIAAMESPSEPPGEATEAPGPIVLGRDLSDAEQHATGAEVRGALALDMINTAFFVAWRVGALRYRASEVLGAPLTAEPLALVLPLEAEGTIIADVHALLPPVLRAADHDALVLTAPDIRIVIRRADTEEVLETVSVGIQARVTGFAEEAGLGVRVEDVALQLDLETSGPDLPLPETLDGALEDLLTQLLAPYLELHGLQLPAFAGLSVAAEQVDAHGGYLRFDGALIPAP